MNVLRRLDRNVAVCCCRSVFCVLHYKLASFSRVEWARDVRLEIVRSVCVRGGYKRSLSKQFIEMFCAKAFDVRLHGLQSRRNDACMQPIIKSKLLEAIECSRTGLSYAANLTGTISIGDYELFVTPRTLLICAATAQRQPNEKEQTVQRSERARKTRKIHSFRYSGWQ